MKGFCIVKLARCLSVVLLIHMNIQSQNNPISEYVDHFSNVVPVTPNAASFTAYGNIPLDLSKGTPNVSIPIYSINLDGVSVPIGLSYDASGIRVNELPTAVGLKWRLNAGGGIFRAINGKLDESGGWATSGNSSYDDAWYLNNPLHSFSTQETLKSNQRDHSPDNFTYNIGNYFGSFIFARESLNTLWKDKKDNFTIIPNINNGLDSFVAKDVNGNFYSFGASWDSRETNATTVVTGSHTSVNGSTDIYKSGWLIDLITTKNNKQIHFEYITYEMSYTINANAQKISRALKCPDPMSGQCLDLCTKDEGGTVSDANYYYTEDMTQITYNPKNKLISKIYTTTEEVNFIYDDYISNAIWDKKLVEIEIKDKIKNTTRSFHFVYDSYTGDQRLRLKELYEEGSNNETKPPYEFSYNQDYAMPAKNTYSRDYFGYYNGANNTSLIPFTAVGYAQLPTYYKDKLADKRPSFNHLLSGNLIKIKYPTGGSTELEYELNIEDNGNGGYKYFQGDASVDASDPNPSTEGSYKVHKTYFTISDFTLGISNVGSASFPHAIRVDSNSNSVYSDGNCNEGLGDIDCVKYYIYNATSPTQLGTLVSGPNGVGYKGFFNLNPGNYFLVMKVHQDEYNQSNLEVYTKLKWYYRAKDANNNFIREPHYAGGLRVKKIKDIDTELIPNTPNYKTYNETKFEYSGLTGQNRVDDYFIQTGMNSGRTVFSSDVIGQPSDFPSGYFYESVLTEKVDGVTLGGLRTLNVFEREYTNNAYSGKQSKTFIYMNGNILIDKTFYIYQFSKTDHDYNILGRLDYCYGSPVSLLGYDTPSQETFSIHEDRLVKQVNTQYFYDNQNNLTNSLTNISEFDYNQDELVSQRIDDARATELQNLSSYDANNYSINYDGDKTIAFYKYPRNYLSETLFQDFVNNKNLLSLPVSVIISKNNELVDGSFVLYDTSGNLKELYKYNKGLGTNSSGYNYIPSTYDLSTIFSVSDGKLIEAQQYLGTIKSYIWDITHTYLLAEITNASYSSIASQITSPLNLATLSDVQLTSEFQTLRQNNPNVQITSYTYDPLIGVTSVTDTRGYTMYYEYDDLNRLKHVKDKDGNILSENLYNYKN